MGADGYQNYYQQQAAVNFQQPTTTTTAQTTTTPAAITTHDPAQDIIGKFYGIFESDSVYISYYYYVHY